MVDRFIKTDRQDHWVHALNYAGIAGMACEMLEDTSVVGVMPGTGTVKVGSAPKERHEENRPGGIIAGMFGARASGFGKRR